MLKKRTAAFVLVALAALACNGGGDEDDKTHDKDVQWTYELHGQYTTLKKKKIGARYELGSRARTMDSEAGVLDKVEYSDGPVRVVLNVNAPPSVGGGAVTCKIVVRKGKDEKVTEVTNGGKNTTTCEFKP